MPYEPEVLITMVRIGRSMGIAGYIRNVIVGVIAGIFMIMPGASGATVTVIFGIYERLIHDVSKLRNIISDWKFLLTVAIGGFIGVVICSKGLDFLVDSYEVPLMFFFAVLILMQIPDIKKQSDDGEKYTPMNLLALVCGFLVMIGILFIGLQTSEQMESPGPIIMFFAGMVYVVCALSPGISGSTILLALGLFGAVIEGVGNLQFGTLIPLIVGALIGVILFAKIIDRCVTQHRKSTYLAILGLTLGSVVTVTVEAILKMDGDDMLVPIAVCIVAGIIAGYAMHLFSKYYASKE
jgi:putative membrane protein